MTESLRKHFERLKKLVGANDPGLEWLEAWRTAMTPSHPRCAEARKAMDEYNGFKTDWDLDGKLC